MPQKAMYNEAQDHHAVANKFGSISKSNQCAIGQIAKTCRHKANHFKVLDLGVGNGTFLKALETAFPNASFTGIDVSPAMLAKAKSNLNEITTIEASATEASQYLPPHSQDLVLAHFINAYIPIHHLFNQANLLTKANGYFSLITTTYESFPKAQQELAEFIAKESTLSRIVGHYYKAIVKNTTVTSGLEELNQVFKKNQFNIIQHQRIEIPIKIESLDELVSFGIEGTWFLNSLSIKLLPKNFLRHRLRRLFSKVFQFPYHDVHLIDVILAEK